MRLPNTYQASVPSPASRTCGILSPHWADMRDV